MVRRALVPGAAATAVGAAIGWAAGGPATGASAAIGVALVVANFAAHGLSLAWASRISVTAVHAVALGGVVLRLGVIVGMLFALDATAWFSPLAFLLAVVPATLLLLTFETNLVLGRRLGTGLDIPPDPAAVRAGERLAAREAQAP